MLACCEIRPQSWLRPPLSNAALHIISYGLVPSLELKTFPQHFQIPPFDSSALKLEDNKETQRMQMKETVENIYCNVPRLYGSSSLPKEKPQEESSAARKRKQNSQVKPHH